MQAGRGERGEADSSKRLQRYGGTVDALGDTVEYGGFMGLGGSRVSILEAKCIDPESAISRHEMRRKGNR